MTAHIRDARDGARDARVAKRHKFRADADFKGAFDAILDRAFEYNWLAVEVGLTVFDLGRQHVHAWGADEVADKGVGWAFKQLFWCADLNDFAKLHDHHLIREGQGFGLVVGHIDHGVGDALVQLFELGAQLPLEVWVDHGERFVKHDDVYVIAHKATAHGDFLFVVRGQAGGLAVQNVGDFQHLGNLGHAFLDGGWINAAVLQREREVLTHGHGVVDHRELEHLRDVALIRRQFGDVLTVKQDLSFGRLQ
mmetsp:Transcript_22319/g.35617  ORF Transcript_22319/g.35617 Transcript_22319/m.35617 type:complete len:251 (+) Transcript_22319:717-1469(+)